MATPHRLLSTGVLPIKASSTMPKLSQSGGKISKLTKTRTFYGSGFWGDSHLDMDEKLLCTVATANDNAAFFTLARLSYRVLIHLYLRPAFLQRCCEKRTAVMQFAFAQLRLVVERLALAQANPLSDLPEPPRR